MSLRAALLALAVCALMLAVGVALVDAGAWPFVLWATVITAALAYERRRYGSARTDAPGPGWERTGERFIDDASGEPVEVWYHSPSGERRYVAAAAKHHG